MDRINFRVTSETIARADALRPRYSTTVHKATRSDVIRVLLLLGLEQAEKDPKSVPLPRERAVSQAVPAKRGSPRLPQGASRLHEATEGEAPMGVGTRSRAQASTARRAR
jgi:hypothetical protein